MICRIHIWTCKLWIVVTELGRLVLYMCTGLQLQILWRYVGRLHIYLLYRSRASWGYQGNGMAPVFKVLAHGECEVWPVYVSPWSQFHFSSSKGCSIDILVLGHLALKFVLWFPCLFEIILGGGWLCNFEIFLDILGVACLSNAVQDAEGRNWKVEAGASGNWEGFI